ncbi:MAG: ABC transporter substrate-binding protein [Thermoanaerobaculia bacterium]
MSRAGPAVPLLLCVLLCVLLEAACGGVSDRPGADTLVVALESGPLHFDPRVGTDQASWRVHDVVYNGLLKKGDAGTYLPDLAESFESPDGVVWNFHLREGVRFQDGRPFGAKDVLFTYRSLLSPDFVSSKKEPLKIIEAIEAPSPSDVTFRLKSPYASFPLQLLLGILPDGTSVADADARPIGTGPYRLVGYKPDERVLFTRWDGCFAGAAKIPKLVFRIVPDATTRALELLRGSLHLSINNLPPDLLPRFRTSPGVAVTIRPGSTYAYLAFNLHDPLLGKRAVRRALALALDRDALVHGLWRDTVVKTETLVPPGHWARAEDIPPLVRNLPEARRLLDEAGFPDPGNGKPRLSITYKTSTDESSVLQATAIAAQWKELGVKTTLRSNDFAVFYQDVVKGSFQLFSLRWQGIVDPDHYHEVFLSTAIPPKGWNRGFFSDPSMDRWIEEARRTLDQEQRRALYREVQLRAAEELPYISLYTANIVAVHGSDLTGLEAMPLNGDFTFLSKVGRR